MNKILILFFVFFLYFSNSFALTSSQTEKFNKLRELIESYENGSTYVSYIDNLVESNKEETSYLNGIKNKIANYSTSNEKVKKVLGYFYIKIVLILTDKGKDINSTISVNYYIPIDGKNYLNYDKTVPNFWNNTLYFADPKLNRVVGFDLKKEEYYYIPVVGKHPGSVDRAGKTDKLYVRTQDSFSFDVLNGKTRKYIKTVPLKHRPRAAGAYNSVLNLQLITGKESPKLSIIDVKNDSVVKTVGKEADIKITSSGGDSATGHAKWIDANHFILLDRFHHEIALYSVIKDELGKVHVSSPQIVKMPAGIHGVETILNPSDNNQKYIFYANVEGDKTTNHVTSVIELNVENGILVKGREVFLGNDINTTVHHTRITPDNKYIYAPTQNGFVYIIDRINFKVVKKLKAGRGAGHVEFSKQNKIAVVTNHYDDYVTIIDTEKQEVIKNVTVSTYKFDPKKPGDLLQAHMNFISSDGKYYLGGAAKDGILFLLDLNLLKVIKKVETGGELIQTISYINIEDK